MKPVRAAFSVVRGNAALTLGLHIRGSHETTITQIVDSALFGDMPDLS